MRHDHLADLLRSLATEVDRMPQREFSSPAWTRARQVRRRRLVAGAAAASVLVALPLVLLIARPEEPVPPADPQPTYSAAPLRGRAAHTATLLADGRVLIVGGCATDGCTTADGLPHSEYYVPGRGFTAGPDLRQPRQGHSATPLPDGRVLIAGGWAREGTAPLAVAEVYQPRTGRFEPVGPLSVGRGGHSAAGLPDGRVLIAGGDTDSAELFDPERNVFTPAAPMPEPRFAAPATTLADGRVLIVGGRDAAGRATASAVIYDPTTDSWQATGSMSTPRDKHALALLPDGRVLVMGGTPDDRELLSSTEIYDPRTGQFDPGPPMDIQRYKCTTAAGPDGRVVIAGGRQAAVYNPGATEFHPIAEAAAAVRWAPTVTILRDGEVLIVGGYDDRIRIHNDALLLPANDIAAAAPAS